MVRIVAEEYLENDDPELEPFYFSVNQLLQRNSGNLRNYLLTVCDSADYLTQLSEFIIETIENSIGLQNKIDKNYENDKEPLNIFRVPDIESNLTLKEQNAYDQIDFGKKILNRTKIFISNNKTYIPKWLAEFVNDKKEKIENFNNNPNHPDYEVFHRKSLEYENVLAGESDIYYELADKLLEDRLFAEVKKYLSPRDHFINNGRSYFAVDDELYQKLVTECQNRKQKANYPKLLDELITDIKQLKLEILQMLPTVPIKAAKKTQSEKDYAPLSEIDLADKFREEYTRLFKTYPNFLEELMYCSFGTDKRKLIDENYKIQKTTDRKMIIL